MAKDLAVQNAKDLIPVGQQIPGLEGIESDMLIIPRLKVVQKMSIENNEPYDIKAGSIVNSVTKDVLAEYTKEGTSLTLLPVVTGRSRIYFRDMKEGGGILCSSRDAKVGEGDPGGVCLHCEMNKWEENGGKTSAPKCTELYNIFCMVRDYDYPIPLTASFGKTSMTAGKQLINLIYNDARRSRLSPWNFAYQLSTKSVTNDFGQFFVFEVKPGGRATEEEIVIGAGLYDLIKSADLSIHEDEDEMKKEAANAVKNDAAKDAAKPGKAQASENRPDADKTAMSDAPDDTPF